MVAFWEWPKLATTQRLNASPTTWDLCCAKNRVKKHLIFEKWEHFHNGQNWPRRKGYSLCKMVCLGLKLKMPKRCEKRFSDNMRLVLWKKNTPKNTQFSKNESILKMAKVGRDAKALASSKMVCLGQKLKMPKRCEKRFSDHMRLVLWKKTSPKNTQYSKNESILILAKIGHDAKAIAFAKWSVMVKN